MSRLATEHLTDAEVADLLAGEPPMAALAQHLSACPHCGAELEQVRLSLSAFTDLSGRWAENEAPARVPVPSRWALGLNGWPTLATGAAVTVLTGLLVFHFGPIYRADAAQPAPPAVATQAEIPTKTELANDNRLMLRIDEELNGRAKPGVSAADLHPDDATSSTRSAPAVVD